MNVLAGGNDLMEPEKSAKTRQRRRSDIIIIWLTGDIFNTALAILFQAQDD